MKSLISPALIFLLLYSSRHLYGSGRTWLGGQRAYYSGAGADTLARENTGALTSSLSLLQSKRVPPSSISAWTREHVLNPPADPLPSEANVDSERANEAFEKITQIALWLDVFKWKPELEEMQQCSKTSSLGF